MEYHLRIAEAHIKEALALMPSVFLNGPRQAGKSTLVQRIAKEIDADYVTFDNITTLAAATNDPEGFLRGFARPIIIDEVQKAPEIFRILKLLVDELRQQDPRRANGRFLLTGSANIMALPGLADALVGRMAVLSLFPLSAVELYGHGKPVINGWFDQDISFANISQSVVIESILADVIARATFPQITGAASHATILWFDDYLNLLLQRDVKELAQIEKIKDLPNIARVLAMRAGGLLNDADCARDAKLNAMTYRRYRILLEQLFLIMTVPPWHRNIGKRLVKSPKIYFADTGLLCHQLGVNPATLQKQNPGLFGHVLENFVASELCKQLTVTPDARLHHFRTQDGKEVDFVIERNNGTLIGIEVKAASNVTADDFSGLRVLKEQVGKDFVRGIVLYSGRDVIPFGEDMIAMPLESLWSFNMEVSTDEDIRRASGNSLHGYIFWVRYGERTRVRCYIPMEILEDHFEDAANSSDQKAIAAIKKHWNIIWPIFVRKIMDGQIETIHHDNGAEFVYGRFQDIRQVTLEPRDFGSKDFR